MSRRITLLGALVLVAGCLFKGPDFFSIVGIDDGTLQMGDVIGRVTGNGMGLNGVAVALSGPASRTTTTSTSGDYSFVGLTSGSQATVTITTPTGFMCPTTSRTVTVPDGDAVRADFECTALPGTVTGTVFDRNGGAGLEGAQVALNGRTTTTDANGNFEFEDVDPGSRVVVTEADGFACDDQTVTVNAGQSTDVQVPCDRTHPTAEQIGAEPFMLGAVLQMGEEDQCGIGTAFTNPGPIVIRVEVRDGVTFLIIESNADVAGEYRIGQPWTGMGEFTFTSGGTTFTLRETVSGPWEFTDGVITLTGTLVFEVFSGGVLNCRSPFDAVYEQLASSSARFKQDVRPVLPGNLSLLGLRPVTFRYRVPWGDPAEQRIGLLAEDVARLFPAAVGFDPRGRPEGIYYLTLRRLVAAEIETRVGTAMTAGIARLARVF